MHIIKSIDYHGFHFTTLLLIVSKKRICFVNDNNESIELEMSRCTLSVSKKRICFVNDNNELIELEMRMHIIKFTNLLSWYLFHHARYNQEARKEFTSITIITNRSSWR
jgi:hypothetical protein